MIVGWAMPRITEKNGSTELAMLNYAIETVESLIWREFEFLIGSFLSIFTPNQAG
jgi:hypothetical protein